MSLQPGGGVEVVALRKRFGEIEAVAGVDLAVDSGELFSLLGPSGCGKTTTLRLVAGFERPDSGRVMLDGVDVSGLPANKRNVNTVFQSYALFPFLTVAENVAFGLRYRKVSKLESARRVGRALELVRLPGFERRRPSQLSGGQQQRVALARALVLEPAVLLLDEPLGALDARLRRALQAELKSLQQELGITFLYVTHDQDEALAMSDRLAVMEAGRILQVGTPAELYEDPVDAHVADFLGVSNLMGAVALGPAGEGWRIGVGDFELSAGPRATRRGVAPGPVMLAIRPERVRVGAFGAGGDNRVPAMVERLAYLGSATQLLVRLAPGHLLEALVPNDGSPVAWSQGSPVDVQLPADALRVLPIAPSQTPETAASAS